MSQLRIYLTHEWRDAASQCAWALLDDAQTILQSGSGNLASMPKADEAVAIIEASQVLCVAQILPKIKSSQLETALPIALEEMMLGEAADQHVVPGALTTEGKTVLYATDKLKLRQFTEACVLVAIRLRRVIPEYCLLPAQRDEWAIVWDGAQGWLALPQQQGMALGHGNVSHLPSALDLLWQSTPTPPHSVRVHFSAMLATEQRVLPTWQGIPVVQGSETFDWRKVRLTADMPNLLWGKFAPAVRMQEWWPKVRPIVWIAVLALCIEALGYNLQWWSLAHEKAQTTKAMNNVFQETFGSEAELVDASLQMRRSLAHARHAAGVADEADLLPLIERVSAELASEPGARVEALRYADGLLDVDLKLATRASLDTLQKRLVEQGLGALVVEVKESGGSIDVHLRISTGGAR